MTAAEILSVLKGGGTNNSAEISKLKAEIEKIRKDSSLSDLEKSEQISELNSQIESINQLAANASRNEGVSNLAGNVIGGTGQAIADGAQSQSEFALARALQGAGLGFQFAGPLGGLAGLGIGAGVGAIQGSLASDTASRADLNDFKQKIGNQTFVDGFFGEGGRTVLDEISDFFVPIQAEKYDGVTEIIYKDGEAVETHAEETHQEMSKKKVTDVTDPDSYVLSARKKLTKKDADLVYGLGVDHYDEKGASYSIEELTLRNQFGVEEKDSIAGAAHKVMKKLKIKNNPIGMNFLDDVTDMEHRESRKKPMEMLVSINESKINDLDIEELGLVPSGYFKDGGKVGDPVTSGVPSNAIFSHSDDQYDYYKLPNGKFLKKSRETNASVGVVDGSAVSVPFEDDAFDDADLEGGPKLKIPRLPGINDDKFDFGDESASDSFDSSSDLLSTFSDITGGFLDEVDGLVDDTNASRDAALQQNDAFFAGQSLGNIGELANGLVGIGLQDAREEPRLKRPTVRQGFRPQEINNQQDAILANDAATIAAMNNGASSAEVTAAAQQFVGQSADRRVDAAGNLLEFNRNIDNQNLESTILTDNQNAAETARVVQAERNDENIKRANVTDVISKYTNAIQDSRTNRYSKQVEINNSADERIAEIQTDYRKLVLGGMTTEASIEFLKSRYPDSQPIIDGLAQQVETQKIEI